MVMLVGGFLIGIDGSGTKMGFILCERRLNLIRKLTLDGSNPNDIGLKKCAEILQTEVDNRRIL